MSTSGTLQQTIQIGGPSITIALPAGTSVRATIPTLEGGGRPTRLYLAVQEDSGAEGVGIVFGDNTVAAVLATALYIPRGGTLLLKVPRLDSIAVPDNFTDIAAIRDGGAAIDVHITPIDG